MAASDDYTRRAGNPEFKSLPARLSRVRTQRDVVSSRPSVLRVVCEQGRVGFYSGPAGRGVCFSLNFAVAGLEFSKFGTVPARFDYHTRAALCRGPNRGISVGRRRDTHIPGARLNGARAAQLGP